MKLENQVVSLNLAKRLKELGFEQESLFIWFENPKNKNSMLAFKTKAGCYSETGSGFSTLCFVENNTFSAYSVAELGEILAKAGKENMPHFCNQATSKQWVWAYGAYPDYVVDDTEANCRAKMLIYLKENKLI